MKSRIDQTANGRSLRGQNRILQKIASGAPLDEALGETCQMIELLEPELRACILILNREENVFDRVIAPSFPEEYAAALSNRSIGPPHVGTSGQAVFNGEPVVCTDVASDDRWQKEWRDLNVAQGVNACRSTPIQASDGRPLGSLFLCFEDAAKMNERIPQVVDVGTNLASIAIEHEQTRQKQKHLVAREKAARREAQAAERRLRKLVGDLNAIVWEADVSTFEFTYVSPQAGDILGYPPQEWLDELDFWSDIIHSNDCQAVVEYCSRHVRNGQSHTVEFRARTAEDDIVWLQSIANVITDETGRAENIRGVMIDITERKRAEEALKEAKEEAEKTARLRSTLLANVSHEIRTPITGILGLAEGLEEKVAEAHREEVRLIEKSGRRLMDTLDSVLALAQLEGGEMEIETNLLDVTAEVDEITDSLRPLAVDKDLSFEVISEAPAAKAELDSTLLDRILNNLVSNAVKFTEEGGVAVEVSASEEKIEIAVSDTGIGISEEFQSRLFEEFTQESTGLARTHEGIGLGLALTKEMTEQLGGEISVTSEKGKGSTFTVCFPRADSRTETDQTTAEPAAEELPPTEKETGRALSLLLMEDNEIIRRVIVERLGERHGYEVEAFEEAEPALERAEEKTFDVVLIDISLPGIDGTEALRQLRASDRYADRPIIAVTGHALPGDRERFLEEGFSDHMGKPFSADELAEKIRSLPE